MKIDFKKLKEEGTIDDINRLLITHFDEISLTDREELESLKQYFKKSCKEFTEKFYVGKIPLLACKELGRRHREIYSVTPQDILNDSDFAEYVAEYFDIMQSIIAYMGRQKRGKKCATRRYKKVA